MKIAFNSYSLRKEWAQMTADGTYKPVVKFIKMLDGVDEVEMLDRTFNSDPKELTKIQEIFASNGLKVFSLGPHPCPLVGQKHRADTIKEFNKWTDMAADHGIHNYRVSLGGGKKFSIFKKPKNNTQAVEWTLEVLRPVVEYAESRDVSLCIETHHRYSSNPDYQAKLLDALPSKNLGFIYDIGNYENDKLRWEALDVLIPRKAIKYMHAKTYAFDAKGLETTLDYPRAIKAMYDAGFDLNLSIEWEGKIPAPEGIFRTYELCKYSMAKAKGEEYTMKTEFKDSEELMKELLA